MSGIAKLWSCDSAVLVRGADLETMIKRYIENLYFTDGVRYNKRYASMTALHMLGESQDHTMLKGKELERALESRDSELSSDNEVQSYEFKKADLVKIEDYLMRVKQSEENNQGHPETFNGKYPVYGANLAYLILSGIMLLIYQDIEMDEEAKAFYIDYLNEHRIIMDNSYEYIKLYLQRYFGKDSGKEPNLQAAIDNLTFIKYPYSIGDANPYTYTADQGNRKFLDQMTKAGIMPAFVKDDTSYHEWIRTYWEPDEEHAKLINPMTGVEEENRGLKVAFNDFRQAFGKVYLQKEKSRQLSYRIKEKCPKFYFYYKDYETKKKFEIGNFYKELIGQNSVLIKKGRYN